jgi:16S rRNA C967 or C1407 C5-methylase (RsmB/RsmF family)
MSNDNNRKRPKFIQVTLTEKEKDTIETYAEKEKESMSTFCRRAIFEYIRRKEHPELFNNTTTSANPEIMEEIIQKTNKIIELQELTNKKLMVSNEVNELTDKIRKVYEDLREKKKVSDFTTEIQEITELLKIHGPLTPQELSNLTEGNISVEDILLIIQTNDKFKLDMKNGKCKLK